MARNKIDGTVWGLAVFILFSVVFAVGWYFARSESQTNSDALVTAQNKAQNLETDLKGTLEEVRTLKALIGRGENEDVGVGESASSDTINGSITKYMQENMADGTDNPGNLEGVLTRTFNSNNKNIQSANDRQQQLALRTDEYQQMVASKDGEIVQIDEALKQAKMQLQQQEINHSEELAQREAQITALSQEKTAVESELAALRVDTQRRIDDLSGDIAQKRQAIIELRRQVVESQDLSFATADGMITSVDQPDLKCYINLGEADGLRTGITFSVYNQNNSGVGRNNTGEIKGKIEIVDILGPHRAQANILMQKDDQPVAPDDQIYSPVFQSGQALEIVVAGVVSQDGLDREQFRRLVTAAGASIVAEVDGEGQFADGKGNVIQKEDAAARINSGTRFLVIAGQGNLDTEDTDVQIRSQAIRTSTEVLKDKALNLGIQEIGLSTFLEHIGYSRKQLSWSSESQQPFPRKRTTQKGQTYSSGQVSGLYSDRKKANTESSGQTSGVYSRD